MVTPKGFVWGFLCCLLFLCGCAGWSYKYYGLSGVDYSRGILLGDKPANDLPFTTCEPNASTKNPCVILKADEFFKLKLDYEDTKQKLQDCQAGKQ